MVFREVTDMNLGLFWPNVIDESSAREAAKQGWYVSLFSGAVSIFSIIVGWTSVWSFVDVILICLAGYGCLKMSRTAAIFGLLLCIVNIYEKYSYRFSHPFSHCIKLNRIEKWCFRHRMRLQQGFDGRCNEIRA